MLSLPAQSRFGTLRRGSGLHRIRASPRQIVVAFGLGLIFIALMGGVPQSFDIFHQRFFTSCTGAITSATVVSTCKSWYVEVSYSYSISKQSFRATNVAPSLRGLTSTGPPADILDHYAVGSGITVYYDPANPADSVLFLAAQWELIAYAFTIILGATIAALGAFWGRNQQPQTSSPNHATPTS